MSRELKGDVGFCVYDASVNEVSVVLAMISSEAVESVGFWFSQHPEINQTQHILIFFILKRRDVKSQWKKSNLLKQKEFVQYPTKFMFPSRYLTLHPYNTERNHTLSQNLTKN